MLILLELFSKMIDMKKCFFSQKMELRLGYGEMVGKNIRINTQTFA